MEFRNIYLVRHGRIRINENEKSFIGQADLPLSEEGEEQVKRLGEILCGVEISSVFCSDLARSVVTAEKISEYHGISPVVKSELREISLGDWDGLTFSEIIRRYPSEFRQRGLDIVNFRPPNGESFQDCGKRVIKVFKSIVNSSKGNIVIAGHAGVNRLLLCHVMGLPVENLFNITQDYGCLNIISFRTSHFRIKLLNETGFF